MKLPFLYTRRSIICRWLLPMVTLITILTVATPTAPAQAQSNATETTDIAADDADGAIAFPGRAGLEGLLVRVRVQDEQGERWMLATIVDGRIIAEGDIVLGRVDDAWNALDRNGTLMAEAELAGILADAERVAHGEGIAAQSPDAPVTPIIRTPTSRPMVTRTPAPPTSTLAPTRPAIATEPAECKSLLAADGAVTDGVNNRVSPAQDGVDAATMATTPQSLFDAHLNASGIYGFANASGSSRWSNGTVPFVLDATLTADQRQVIADAIADWQALTPIVFVNRTDQTSWVRFVRGTGCSSAVGRTGGEQTITLQWDAKPDGTVSGCFRPQATHEIGHAIGLWHEHTRPDRDNVININWSNIKSDMRYNFCKRTGQLPLGGYDLSSLMHYRGLIADKSMVIDDTKPTITLKNGNAVAANNRLSSGDVAAVADLYGRTPGLRLEPGRPLFNQSVTVVVRATDPVTGQALDSPVTIVTYDKQTGPNPVPVTRTGRTGVPLTVTFRTGTKVVITGKGPIITTLYPTVSIPAQTVGNIAYKATAIEVGRN